MSGGQWNYQAYRIEEIADALEDHRAVIVELLKAAVRSEHIIDWSESGDTTRRREDGTGAEKDLYDLWLETFRRLYGE